MALSYLFDPNKQFQAPNGLNNVNGFLRVFIDGTDDYARTFKNFNGTLNQRDIRLDNNGRAVVIVDADKVYRLEVYSPIGNLLWTQYPMYSQGAEVIQVESRGKIHKIGIWAVDVSDPSPKPNEYWVLDLESPNENAPGGYDRLTVEKAREIHNSGSFFGLRTEQVQNPYEDNLLLETYFEYVSMAQTFELKLANIQDSNELSEFTLGNFGDYVGVSLVNERNLSLGKLHRISVRSVQAGDPSPKPQTDWIIDLESPNASEPDGYDRLTVARAIEIHENGEVFAFASSASNTDTYYESLFNSSPGYVHMTLVRSGFHQRPNEVSIVTVDGYGDYLGISNAFQDSEYWNVTLVKEGSDELRQNKIHRYSFGDGIVNGETPIYGSWLIDLDKPDPDGPEGYARVTPAEFWRTTAVNGEIPVYLQDKNANNSLTYAYLSRADVTKSGNTVTNVFSYFVRSGYGNDLSHSMGFRFTKHPDSDYLQKASATDDLFEAFSANGVLPIANGGTNASTVADARTNLDVYSKTEVNTAIDTAVASAYHAAGTKTVAQLTNSLLVAANLGNVYNITDSGTTTADFVDGAGHPINAGDNVGICDVGGGVYKFDLLSGFVDLSGYKTKQTAVTDPTADGNGLSFIDSASQNANGEVTLHKKTVQDGTTTQKGVVQLEDSVSSTATDKAATPNAVKTAYDLISSKANDSDVVHKAGDETITGRKTISAPISPLWKYSNNYNQSKFFVANVIKNYSNWTNAEKDGNHYRQWTINFTSIMQEGAYNDFAVSIIGSYRKGILTKRIFCVKVDPPTNNSDYIIAQNPAASEFVISDLIKEGNTYAVKILHKYPYLDVYPSKLQLDYYSDYDIQLNNAICTGEIISGWPAWAGDINTPVKVTASGSPVLTEATAATVAKTGNYSDLTGKPLVYWSSQYDAALVAVSDGIYNFSIAWPTGIDTTKNYILEVTALFNKDASELSQLNGDDLPFHLSLLTTGHLALGTCGGVMTSIRATTGYYYGNTSLMTRITSSMLTGSTLYCQLVFPNNILTLADTFGFTVRLRFTEAP